MNKTVALYARVSTLEMQDTGLKSQEQALIEYCQNHNITTFNFYNDKASGGQINNRPQLKRLQQDIFTGKVKTVIVWKLDRLSRSLKDGINLLIDWLDRGVRVIAVSQQFDFNGSVGKLVASVLLGIAEMERQNIRENIVRGMKAAKDRGVKIGGREAKIHSEDIIRLKEQGLKMTEIATEMKCSRQALYLALGRIKYQHSPAAL